MTLAVQSPGSDVAAHKNACVMGYCLGCAKKQNQFFKCPKHRGISSGGSSTGEGELKWEVFVLVDDKGNEIPQSSRSQRNSAARRERGDDSDEEWKPHGSAGSTPRKVCHRMIRFYCIIGFSIYRLNITIQASHPL